MPAGNLSTPTVPSHPQFRHTRCPVTPAVRHTRCPIVPVGLLHLLACQTRWPASEKTPSPSYDFSHASMFLVNSSWVGAGIVCGSNRPTRQGGSAAVRDGAHEDESEVDGPEVLGGVWSAELGSRGQ
jgi:hypothetical protein